MLQEADAVALSGERVLAADQAEVWSALTDIDLLRTCLPGCERLVPRGGNRFELAVAPWIGSFQLDEIEAPRRCALRFAAADEASGAARGQARLELAAAGAGACRFTYEIALESGPASGSAEADARRYVEQALDALDARLAARAAAAAAFGGTPAPRRRVAPRTPWQRLRAYLRRLSGASCCD